MMNKRSNRIIELKDSPMWSREGRDFIHLTFTENYIFLWSRSDVFTVFTQVEQTLCCCRKLGSFSAGAGAVCSALARVSLSMVGVVTNIVFDIDMTGTGQWP